MSNDFARGLDALLNRKQNLDKSINDAVNGTPAPKVQMKKTPQPSVKPGSFAANVASAASTVGKVVAGSTKRTVTAKAKSLNTKKLEK